MSGGLSNSLQFNKNQAEELVFHNLLSAPSNPALFQVYGNSTPTDQRAYIWTGTPGVNNGKGWIPWDVTVDNYVDGATFSSSTGVLTLTRTGTLPDLTVSLDGRYLQTNQTITLSGDIAGSGTTAITTTLQPGSITDKPNALLNPNQSPQGSTWFLVNQDGVLRKHSFQSIADYINNIVDNSSTVSDFTLSTTPGTNPISTHTLTTATSTFNTSLVFQGTNNEVLVEGLAGNIVKIGLPDDVTISNNLVVQGDLTVNGTTTTLNTEELKVEDNIITVNSNVIGIPPITNAGIEVQRGLSPNTAVIWNESTDRWTFTNDGTTYFNIPIPSEYTAYVHPTYTPRVIDGSGLQFVQDFTSDSTGHVTGITLASVPSANTSVIGVVRFATSGELISTNTTTVVSPADVFTIVNQQLGSSSFKTVISTTSVLNHNFGTLDVSIYGFDTVTKESVIIDAEHTDINNITILIGIYPNPIRIILTKH